MRNDGGDNQPLIEETLSLPAEDILMIHVADGQTVEHHCPDFALLSCIGLSWGLGFWAPPPGIS